MTHAVVIATVILFVVVYDVPCLTLAFFLYYSLDIIRQIYMDCNFYSFVICTKIYDTDDVGSVFCDI